MRLTSLIIAACTLTGSAAFAAEPFIDPAPSDVVIEQNTTTPNAITGLERMAWWTQATVGPQALLTSSFSAGWGTMLNTPHEAGPHIGGFGERYGSSVAGNATSNALEASLGAIWGEDPRYVRAGSGNSLKSRMGHIALWTVAAPDRTGELRPAYARFAAVTGSSFLSNTWREQSEADTSHALGRIAFGLLGRMGSNTFNEFWPDAKIKLFRHKGTPYPDSVSSFKQ